MPDVAWRFLHIASTALARKNLDLRVEGLASLPRTGPVILAARHVHHLYDGVAIIGTIPRPVHILVGLDWAGTSLTGIAMTRLCNASRWPIVYRPGSHNARSPQEMTRAARKAMAESLRLLAEGRILLVFPEGYPNIDPHATPKTGLDDWLPFQPGVVRLAAMAAAQGITVPIVPVGLEYREGEKWTVTIRFGEPILVPDRAGSAAALQAVEARVHALSGAESS